MYKPSRTCIIQPSWGWAWPDEDQGPGDGIWDEQTINCSFGFQPSAVMIKYSVLCM